MGSEAAGTQRFQRRTVLVKRHLQLKYAFVVFAAVAFTAMIVGGDVYYTMARFLKEADPGLMPLLSDAMRMDLVKLVIFLGIMGIVTLFVSHRWAGPIFRFERSAQIVAGGDLTHRVSLRTGDDLMELQDEFNAMITGLQRLVQKDRTLVERLQGRLEEAVKGLPESAGAAETERLKGALRELKEELRHVTSAFKV
ncbi:MAG: methyl-accepting chemotaxis protein [Elusimicrobia bacterium]|nr:methyl-accepting chemotaxis protein [Elusimicrobiota bacterium]